MGLDTSDSAVVPLSPAASPAPEAASNFFFGFLILPKAKRRALAAVYAYCRLIDDIVDQIPKNVQKAKAGLSFWREELERLYRGNPTHPTALALMGPVADFKLPQAAFLEVIRGCEMDLVKDRYESFEALEPYLQGVACAVGRLVVEILGYRHTSPERMEEFVKYFGYAFQMTNILRDVAADLEMNRIYLPLSDIKESGYSLEKLIRREHDEAFERLMEQEYRRTKTFYARARNAVNFKDRPALLCAEIMGHIYERILDKIKEEGFRVFSGRTSLSKWEKLSQAVKAWLYCHGIF